MIREVFERHYCVSTPHVDMLWSFVVVVVVVVVYCHLGVVRKDETRR